METTITQLINILLSLNRADRKKVIAGLFKELSDEERKQLYNVVTLYLIKHSRWIKIDNWMEKTFSRHFEWTPYKVAMMALNYFKLSPKMKPFMIKHAQRVKKRVNYHIKKSNTKPNKSLKCLK